MKTVTTIQKNKTTEIENKQEMYNIIITKMKTAIAIMKKNTATMAVMDRTIFKYQYFHF